MNVMEAESYFKDTNQQLIVGGKEREERRRQGRKRERGWAYLSFPLKV